MLRRTAVHALFVLVLGARVSLADCPGFGGNSEVNAGFAPNHAAVGDFTGDGIVDLVTVVETPNVFVIPGTGGGNFGGLIQAAEYHLAAGLFVVAGDLNRDGKLDAVAVLGGFINGSPPNFDRIAVMLGNGNGTFATPLEIDVGPTPGTLAIADLNRDGALDLAVSKEDGNIALLMGNGAGGFGGVTNLASGVTHPGLVVSSDLNADGKVDLIVSGSSSNNVAILLGHGDGSFAAPATHGTGSFPNDIVVSDFNRDGKSDLAVANAGNHNVSILTGDGNGGFAAAVNYSAGNAALGLAGADFNGDGRQDLFAGNQSGSASVLLGNGDGTFAAPLTYAISFALDGVSTVFATDLSGDGRPDLAALTGVFHVRVNTSLCSSNCATFATPVNYAAGSGPNFTTSGDFNRDGRPDLAIVNGNDQASVLLQNGDGTFAAGVNYNTGAAPIEVIARDFNRDGRLDLATANSGSNNFSILLGNAGGTFGAASNFGAGTQPRGLESGDFNHDGRLDVAVVNQTNVIVFTGDGNGSFSNVATLTPGPQPDALAVADFNRDGNLDLAVANNSGASIFLGNGNASFSAATNFAAGSSPFSIVAKDFNADGKFDLATANFDSHVAVILGNGNGTFGAPANYNIATALLGIAAADLNGDGKEDLAVAVFSTDQAAVLLGHGNGTFAAPVPSAAGSGPAAIAIEDLDVDGKPDLVVSNSNSSNVSILFNTCPPPDLSIVKTHDGDFVQGDTGRTYTITVTNDGAFATNGVVTVVDTLPASLTATAIEGTGWTCTLGTHTCTRGDALAIAASYPPITLTVSVANDAPSSVVNSVQVFGGGDVSVGNNTTTDPTTITKVADLTLTKSHDGNFTQGQEGAVYSLTVHNIGELPTTAPVTVSDTLPAGLVAVTIAGDGWTCILSTLVCSRSDVLDGAESYPPITLTVNVNSNAGNVTNTASVSGGGEFNVANNNASDPTTVHASSGIIAPTNVVATAISGTQILLTWNPVTGGASYQIFRSSDNNVFTFVASPTVTTYTDSGLTPNTTYMYRVRAADPHSHTGTSNIDLATTIVFDDDPLVAGTTVVKAVHVTQLRTAVNAVRAAAGLAPANFTNPVAPGAFIRALDVVELRTNLDAARTALGFPAVQYVDPGLPAGTFIKAAHFQDLRFGVK